MEDGLCPLFLLHTCDSWLVQLCVAMTPPTEKPPLFLLFSFVSVGFPTVMWGFYRLIFFFILVHVELQLYFYQLQESKAKPAERQSGTFLSQNCMCTNKSSSQSSWWHWAALWFGFAFNFHIPQQFLWDCIR